jgi:ATP/maltotriose-dependent transcriptional regulator MalT
MERPTMRSKASRNRSGKGNGRGIRLARCADFIVEKKLNVREIRTLDLLAACLENKEIASELGVSGPVTAKIIRCVFLKLGVHRRTEAILRWKSLE